MAHIILLFNGQLRTKYHNLLLQIPLSNRRDKNIPASLYKAVIGIEDKRYFNHRGIDIYSISRAARNNLFYGRFEGASTITQQLVRTITNERQQTLRRKLNEIILAVLIDHHFTKMQILYCYFNSYQFGDVVGVGQLCKKKAYALPNLCPYEIALIAARFKYPNLSKGTQPAFLRRVKRIETMIAAYNKNYIMIYNQPGGLYYEIDLRQIKI